MQMDQLYTQVDKTNKKKASKKLESTPRLDVSSSSIDQLYAQVNHTNKKKANKKDTDVLPEDIGSPLQESDLLMEKRQQ